MQLSSKLRRIYLVIGCFLLVSTSSTALAAKPIKFAEPSWPGVNVKTEVVEQLLNTLGYPTKTSTLNLAFIYRGLAQGEIDVFMGVWLPSNKNMVDPLFKKHQIVKLAVNLSDARLGLAVPHYVWKNGIHTVKDAVAHGDRFDHKLYAIEAGSAMNQAFKEAVENDYEGLGSWKVIPSSTAGMLSQVERSTKRRKPIVFYAWRPHWMDVRFDIRFLKDSKSHKIADIQSRVLTVASATFPKAHPNVSRLLRQLKVTSKIQSYWIDQYSKKKKKKTDVAKHWLTDHSDTVSKWLKGVKTADGGSAVAAYQERYP